MKTPDYNEELHRWIDGAMNDAERAAFQAEFARNPALADEAASLKLVSGLLKDHATLERPVPNPDFFNSQIQERIAAEQRAEDRVREQRSTGSSWLSWLFRPWALAGAAALIAAGVFLTQQLTTEPKTEIVGFYAPDPSIKATPSYNKDAAATVLMLDGLAAVPSDHVISGLTVHHSETDPEVAATTLYDGNGKVLLVMSTDAASKPVIVGGSEAL
jgi:hypothetical protein